MRVAYVCADPGVPVFGTKGCSVHVQGVLGALARAGAGIDVFAARLGGAPPTELARLALHEHGRPRTADAASREFALAARNPALADAIAAAGPFDIVLERQALFAWAGMTAARRTGAAAVLEVNAPLAVEQAAHRTLIDRAGAEAGLRHSFGAAEVIVAVSRVLGEQLERIPQARGKVAVVPNGVDPARFASPCARRADRAFTVAFVGTLKPWHGLDTLVDAFARLRERVADARLLVIGDGPGRAELERALETAGLTQAAHLTGAVASADVGRLLAGADATVAPYGPVAETYFSPLKVVEGMAAGLPVVASRVGQLPELIRDGETGVLCPPGNAAALACALAGLARDPARAAAIGAAARTCVLHEHTWDRVVARILGLAGVGVDPVVRAA